MCYKFIFSVTDLKTSSFTQSRILESLTANNSTLRISFVTYEDAGVYECEADNGINPGIKANFTVTIRGKNVFIGE